MLSQEWIRKALEKVTVEHHQQLLMGVSSAFVGLHCGAMLELVTGEPIEKYPETLSFDDQRLKQLRSEFHFLILAVTMVAFSLNLADDDTLKAITDNLASRKDTRVHETVRDICEIIEQSGLTPEKQSQLKNRMRQSTAPSSVRELMTTRVKAIWSSVNQGLGVPGNVQLPRGLIPRVENAATRLRAVTDLNRAVHTKHYNKIIREEALKTQLDFVRGVAQNRMGI